jgi:hypothetical protein
MRFATMLMKILLRTSRRHMGRQFFTSPGSFPGFGIGTSLETFHSGNKIPPVSSFCSAMLVRLLLLLLA